MPSTPPVRPRPDDANKKNEHDASEANKRVIATIGQRRAHIDQAKGH